MKLLRKAVLAVMTLAMLLSCVAPSFAEETVPIPDEFGNYIERFKNSTLSKPMDESDIPYFEEILSFDRAEFNHTDFNAFNGLHKYSYTYIENVSYCIGSTGIKITAYCAAHTDPPYIGTHHYFRGYKEAALFAYITDKETGNILSCQIIKSGFPINHYDEEMTSATETVDIYLNLPEDFSPEKHSLFVFLMPRYVQATEYAPAEDPNDYNAKRKVTKYREILRISEPREIDLSTGADRGSGDVNGDGKVNLMDIHDYLYELADSWYVSGFDFVAADADLSGEVNLTDAAIVLKRIAGHTTDDTVPAKHADKFAAIADEMYAEFVSSLEE